MNSKLANELLKSLKKVAATSKFDINELRVILAMERLVARITSDAKLSPHLVFKGDIGFGDEIPKNLKPSFLLSILPEEDQITWKVYPPEFIVAEKLQTFVKRGSANSRVKIFTI